MATIDQFRLGKPIRDIPESFGRLPTRRDDPRRKDPLLKLATTVFNPSDGTADVIRDNETMLYPAPGGSIVSIHDNPKANPPAAEVYVNGEPQPRQTITRQDGRVTESLTGREIAYYGNNRSGGRKRQQAAIDEHFRDMD